MTRLDRRQCVQAETVKGRLESYGYRDILVDRNEEPSGRSEVVAGRSGAWADRGELLSDGRETSADRRDATSGRPQTLLLDTCVLIDHLRGYGPAKVWLTEEVAREDVRFVYSVITYTELLVGLSGSSDKSGRAADNRQKDAILALLGLMEPIPVSVGIAAQAADYVREWGKSRGVAVPDALIAATARDVGAVLITRDASHFPMTDITVCRPY